MKKIKCIICRKDIIKTTNNKTCNNLDCKKSYYKLSYHKRKAKKRCKYCETSFLGKRQEKLCVNCKGHRKLDTNKKQLIVCPKCNEIVGFKLVKCLHKKPIKNRSKCKKCKEEEKQKITFCEYCKSKISYIKYKKKFCSKKCRSDYRSFKMTKDNPMYNKNSVTKMKKTLQDNIKNGKTEYKKGPDHHLWKGNRKLATICRTELYNPWVKKVLARDGFMCRMCKQKSDLQVHHIRIFKEIFNLVLDKMNISDINKIDVSSKLAQQIIKNVIKEHKISDGITVCKICHGIIDDKYRRYKNNEN